MGHQLNFHATLPDVARLEEIVRAIEPVVVLHSRSPTAEPRIVPSVNFEEQGRRWLFYFLVREADLGRAVTEPVPAQGYWSVDVLRSPVVQFTNCYFDGLVLRRGRIYYVDGYYGADGTWVEKPETFRLWAATLRKATRKALSRRDGDYIGREAALWLEREGGRLEG